MDAECDRASETRQARYREVSAHLESLPLLPLVVARLLELDRDDANYFETVLHLGEQDPAFAVHLIRAASSSVFGPATPIADLRSAVARIGAHRIAVLATSLAVMQIFVPGKKETRDLWLHSIQVALSARFIAQRYFNGRVDPETAYLCGMLHDVGRFIVFEVVPVEVDASDEEGWNTSETLIDMEQRMLGIPHTELGALICRKWLLPDSVVQVVRLHHVRMVAAAARGDNELRNLLSIAWLADHFSMVILYHSDIEALPPSAAIEAFDRRCISPFKDPLPMTAADLYALMPEVVDEARRYSEALGLPVE